MHRERGAGKDRCFLGGSLLFSACLVLGACQRAEEAPVGQEIVYRYENDQGTTVVVPVRSQIPAKYRAKAKPVVMNRPTGNEALSGELAQQRKVSRPPPIVVDECGNVVEPGGWRALLPTGRTREIWMVVTVLLIAGGLFMVFRWVGLVAWVRALVVALPLFALIALLYVGGKKVSAFRGGKKAVPVPKCQEVRTTKPTDPQGEEARDLKALKREIGVE